MVFGSSGDGYWGSGESSVAVGAVPLVRQKEPMPSTPSFAALLKSIKERIQAAQVRAIRCR
jgi:hypothetical protein